MFFGDGGYLFPCQFKLILNDRLGNTQTVLWLVTTKSSHREVRAILRDSLKDSISDKKHKAKLVKEELFIEGILLFRYYCQRHNKVLRFSQWLPIRDPIEKSHPNLKSTVTEWIPAWNLRYSCSYGPAVRVCPEVGWSCLAIGSFGPYFTPYMDV